MCEGFGGGGGGGGALFRGATDEEPRAGRLNGNHWSTDNG